MLVACERRLEMAREDAIPLPGSCQARSLPEIARKCGPIAVAS